MIDVNASRRAAHLTAHRDGRLLVLAGILAAFAVRLYQLGGESLWYDETVSVYLARLPLPAMLAHSAGDIHPPGYYALLHLWQALAQPSLLHGLEFLFAWPSLVFGMLVLPLLYAIGKRLFGARTALAALLLAAFNPFGVWYSQEVRMYTLGASLGLLCLWAVLKFTGTGEAGARPAAGRSKVGWLAVFVVAAAAGLYTLYYFLFLLAALNVIALLLIWLRGGSGADHPWRQTGGWLLSQLAVLLLWLPWLPVFWRQATDPPVPPWRTAWETLAALLHSVAETLSALIVGQSPPGAVAWPWAIVAALMLVGLFVLASLRTHYQTTGSSRRQTWLSAAVVLIYVFVPTGVLYAGTLLGSPIYHVRYLALYAPLFLLIPAWLVVYAWREAAWLGASMCAELLLMSALALLAFWFDPLYRADDHRQAVAELAQSWRPGDAILANAGWIYPVFSTYWPTELASDGSSLPPPLQPPVRIVDYGQNSADLPVDLPLLVRTGSVDGPPQLGWGDPDSDFFAASSADTTAALSSLAEHARRIWHYRMYDTVSDPGGVIRAWLQDNTQPVLEKPIPGRDFGLVQLFETPAAAADAQAPSTGSGPAASFGGAIELSSASVPTATAAGSYLYVDLNWQALLPLAGLPADLSTSLRLYDGAGQQVAQADGPPSAVPTRSWETGKPYPQAAALPIPANLQPGTYSLAVIVYRQDDAQALPVDGSGEQAWPIADVVVSR